MSGLKRAMQRGKRPRPRGNYLRPPGRVKRNYASHVFESVRDLVQGRQPRAFPMRGRSGEASSSEPGDREYLTRKAYEGVKHSAGPKPAELLEKHILRHSTDSAKAAQLTVTQQVAGSNPAR